MNHSIADPNPVKVGILHSLTGTMAISEIPLRDAALMAIAEINQAGGVLGRSLLPMVEDGASDPIRFAMQAHKLIQQDEVATVFGCWTSLSRKAVLPIFEAFNALLWYPLQYEGLEQSKNIFYTGSCPNQQVEPAVIWLLQQQKRRFYLIGSDYVFPRTANKFIRGELRQQGGIAVGEEYVSLGAIAFTEIIDRIQQIQPDVVFSTLNGDSNLAFYQQYKAAGIFPEEIPIMAVSVAEVELQQIGAAAVGHYACWSYFQSVDTPQNRQFVQAFQQRYGADQVTSDPIEAAYTQVYLWKQAVEAAQSFEVDRVRQAAYGQTFAAPGGTVKLASNHHLWKACRIGQVQPNGQFAIVDLGNGLIKPLPWLGVEEASLSRAGVIIDLLAEVSQGIQYSWDLEQKSHALETAMHQLQQEVAQRQEAEAALRVANDEITQLNEQLKAENLRMGAELEITRRMQQMLLPPEEELQQVSDLEIAGFMAPADEVGGDYYDVLQHHGKIKIGIGDVTGHGLESGVVMLMVQTAVQTLQIMNEHDPVKLLSVINQVIHSNTQRMKSYKNMSLMLLDYEAGCLRLSGQHEELILVRQNGQVEQIDTLDLGFPLGLEKDITPFIGVTELHLESGDLAVLYTDGISEAMNPAGQQYGLERLSNVLRENRDRKAGEIRQAAIADLMQYIGTQKVFDDITLVVMKQK